MIAILVIVLIRVALKVALLESFCMGLERNVWAI
jgi:hypothetical protein